MVWFCGWRGHPLHGVEGDIFWSCPCGWSQVIDGRNLDHPTLARTLRIRARNHPAEAAHLTALAETLEETP